MDPFTIVSMVAKLIQRIADLAKQGVSDEEIKERLFAPGEVGADIIDAVKRREKAASDYLGR